MKKNSTATNYIALAGSERGVPDATKTTDSIGEETMEVTVRVRRKKSITAQLKKNQLLTREDYEKTFGMSRKDVQQVEDFAGSFHLAISGIFKDRRSIMLKGKVSDFEKAFQVQLSLYRSADGTLFRGRVGNINIPQNLDKIIEGVFGLDNRLAATPKFQVAQKEGKTVAHGAAAQSYYPTAIAKLYGFPTGVNGKGQCIALIELGGGYRTADLNTYFSGLGIPTPATVAVSVDGAINSPSTPDGADGEVMLDIEVAGAIAPAAKIVVYFAPNTDKGFLDAITNAIHDTIYKPSVISISWGSAEKNWTQQSLTNFNEAFKTASLLGVTICAAAGDEGSSDGQTDGKVHVDFPASSPYVLGCGGTKLVANGTTITAETVWHESDTSATGGGVSDFFPLPDYQKGSKVPPSLSTGFAGRGVPDVAGDADPNTGYKVLVDGQQMVIGGTSAVAPLMAGLIALINQRKKKPAGFINPVLYSNRAGCRDITQGDNITTPSKKGYKAGPGWDACTGLGVLSSL